MKTYLLDILNKIKRLDESLDIKTVLCNKSWVVFDEDEGKHTYIFKEDGGLVIASKGKGVETSWEYLLANQTIKFKDQNNAVELYHPTIIDDSLLALNLDGTNEYALLLNESALFKPKKLEDIIIHIKEIDGEGGKNKALPTSPKTKSHAPEQKMDPSIESKQTRTVICYANHSFTPAEWKDELFYVYENNRYAFSSVVHVFPDALLVTDKKGQYIMYYNNSMDKNCSYFDEPTWEEYWDGLVLDGILFNKKLLYRDGFWSECNNQWTTQGRFILRENKEGVKEFFKIADKKLTSVSEQEMNEAVEEHEKNQSEESTSIVLIFLIGGFVLAIMILTIVAAAS